ncbi:MAG TPA: hypothetical protein VFL78_07595 [Rhodanobacteraceae bacterium]|nr:hypothetical protein [Rhodanobacteraceae bacterium]
MKRGWHITRRTRLRLTLLAVLALLCQQMAFAAYVCAPVDMPTHDVAMAMHCQDMSMTRHATPAQQASALCAYHCAHQPTSMHDAQLPNVPPSSLPAIVPAPPFVAQLPLARVAHTRTTVRRMPPLPPPLRYRVLLI